MSEQQESKNNITCKKRDDFLSNGRRVALLLFFAASIFFCACGSASQNGNSSATKSVAASSPTPQKSSFERDLEYTRSSQSFNKIYVFARKDGNAIESTDGDLLKAKAPADPHIWWVVTDEKRRVIMATYSDFAPEKLNSLRAHFNVEDYTNR